MDKSKAEQLKQEGNAATAAGRHEDAVRLYSEAVALDPENHVLWSNRSAAHAQLHNYQKALDDAQKTILCNPKWAKGYSRKGAALCYLKRYDDAIEAYEEGLKVDPDSKLLRDGLNDAHSAKDKAAGPGSFPNPFSDPNALAKLAVNPKTRHLAADQEFVTLFKLVQNNPQMLTSLLKDERIMLALTTLMGVDLNMDEPSDTASPTTARNNGTTSASSGQTSSASKSSSTPSSSSSSSKSPSATEDVEMTDVSQKALSEKEKGNAAYKKRDFSTALQHYEQAVTLDPSNMTFLLNIAAVYFEESKYEECAAKALEAVELGRANRADFKMVSKAFSRAANAYYKMEDLNSAKLYYEKALSEHRSPELRAKLSEVEKKIKEDEDRKYRDPQKAEELRLTGNEQFKQGNYSEAVKTYTEALRRNPDDAKIYSNRAACYTKLAAFDLGVKDCDKCIAIDPQFVKGYVRKGILLKAMNQLDKAMDAYQKAINIDENNAEATAGYRDCLMAADKDPEAIRRRAMSDPEVQDILRDPSMRLILDQMREDPQAAKEHLKNPDIAQKIQKLLSCGLIAFQ